MIEGVNICSGGIEKFGHEISMICCDIPCWCKIRIFINSSFVINGVSQKTPSLIQVEQISIDLSEGAA